MARSLEQERQSIEEDERRLAERKQRLAERQREEAIAAIDRAGLLALDGQRIAALTAQIRALGIDEVEKRLAA